MNSCLGWIGESGGTGWDWTLVDAAFRECTMNNVQGKNNVIGAC